MGTAEDKSVTNELETTELTEEAMETEDSLTFSNGAIEKIVAFGLHDVSGLVGMKGGLLDRMQDTFGMSTVRRGITIDVTPEGAVVVTISAIMAYGAYAPQIFEDVKKAVVNSMQSMTGLPVAGVHLRIEEVYTPEEVAERQPSLPDPESHSQVAGELPE